MTDFRQSFAERTTRVNPSPIREILKLVARPDIISFAGGMPAQDLFPYEAIQAANQRALGDARALASLQYGLTEGYAPLREEIARSLADEGIHVGPERVVITTGLRNCCLAANSRGLTWRNPPGV